MTAQTNTYTDADGQEVEDLGEFRPLTEDEQRKLFVGCECWGCPGSINAEFEVDLPI